MNRPIRYIICQCDQLYARTMEPLPSPEVANFTCTCGVVIGVWNGFVALRYHKLDAADETLRASAVRVPPQNNTAAA